jgi:cation diffusion facilitator CzcD-associated flavoprotein CzcO
MVMGDAVEETDCVVIGAGPGGYVAALRLRQLGKQVILIDRDGLGGVWWDTIPKGFNHSSKSSLNFLRFITSFDKYFFK